MASDKIRNKITLSLTSYQLADDDLQYAFCLINQFTNQRKRIRDIAMNIVQKPSPYHSLNCAFLH